MAVPGAAHPLPALRHALVGAMFDSHVDLLRTLIDGLGSPLHLVFPQVFEENAQRFNAAFAQANVPAQILFAKKANKADCLARRCASLGIGIDVASSGELEKALAAGIPGAMVGISGPEKTDHLIGVALRHRCLIAVDSASELARIDSMASASGLVARILLRCQPRGVEGSRFGMCASEQAIALAVCRSGHSTISLEGVSFHLSGYHIAARAHAASEMIDLCVHAQGLGLRSCRHVNLGGGLPVQYVSPENWAEFCAANLAAHYHTGRQFGGFYPYGSCRSGAEALADLLDTAIEDGLSLSDKVRRNGIKLIIEPGRALLDQAGITVFRVQGVKHPHATNVDSYAIVVVQGTSFSLSEQWFDSEYLPDPILVFPGQRDSLPFAACVGGASCLEADMLSWRKIAFGTEVRAGDLLVYPNTAGYQMDSNESPFHEARLPYKVAVEIKDGKPGWKLDGVE